MHAAPLPVAPDPAARPADGRQPRRDNACAVCLRPTPRPELRYIDAGYWVCRDRAACEAVQPPLMGLADD
jgi:hypothetical protein